MKPVTEVRWLVYDYGNYLSIAKKLAEVSAAVYYFVPKIINGYPDHRPLDIGRNVPGVILIKEYEPYMDLIDAVVFPDVHEPGKQLDFIKRGKYVVGCGAAGKLELDRVFLKRHMIDVGLPVNGYDEAHGFDELNELLKDRKGVYVKSGLRGDMETWKSKDHDLSQEDLDDMRHHMDAYKNEETYIIEEEIESVAEIGIDTFVVDGKYPEMVITGIELKDTGFLGMAIRYKDLPRQLRNVTDKLSPILAELRHRGPISDEVIVSNNGKGYLLDWTARFPQPPSDLYMEMIEDFPTVLWEIAQGIVPNVQYKAKYGVQLIIKSEMAKTRTVRIRVPDEFKANVKLKNMIIEQETGLWAYTPMMEMQEIGSVIAFADTKVKAYNLAKKIAESIEGNNIKINTDCISKANEQIDKLHKAGINYM